MTFVSAIILSFLQPAFAESLEGHEHGIAHLKMAMETSRSVSLLLSIPEDTLYGFEGPPKSDKQKEAQKQAKNTFEKKFSEFLIFDKISECNPRLKSYEIKNEKTPEGVAPKHSEVVIEYDVMCLMPATGTEFSTSISKMYKKIKKVAVEFQSRGKPATKDLKSDRDRVELGL